MSEQEGLQTYVLEQNEQRVDRTYTYTYEQLRAVCDIGTEFEVMAIDEDLAKQPALYEIVAQETAKRRALTRKKKAELERTVSSSRLAFRAQALRTNEKTTEGKLEDQVNVDPVVVAKREEYLKAMAEEEQFEGLREAFKQRHDTLRGLTSLLLSNVITQRKFSKEFASAPLTGNGTFTQEMRSKIEAAQ